MTEITIQPVDMHEAFKRDPSQPAAQSMVYVNLNEVSWQAGLIEPALFRAFLNSEAGTIDEVSFARKTAIGNLVLTGAQLQGAKSSEKKIISERFTQACIELYGRPDSMIAKQLAAAQIIEFEKLSGNPSVDQNLLRRTVDFLKTQVGDVRSLEIQDNNFETELKQMRQLIFERYSEILSGLVLDGEPATLKIPAAEIAERFQRSIDKLTESDPAWDGWKARETPDAAMETIARKKLVGVGRKARQVGGLEVSFTHEVLGHALRSVNGSKTNDEHLQYGLPGSHVAEEGVAVFNASAVRGHTTETSKDFYMDTAFALGQLGLPPISRTELHGLYLDRLVIRSQAKAATLAQHALSDKAWGYVNRIYRGSLGNEYIAINTLDSAYYRGFREIGGYVKAELAKGKAMGDIFDFLTAARFDPLNPRDIEYREKVLDNKEQYA